MDALVNIVGTFVAGLCAILLLRAYAAFVSGCCCGAACAFPDLRWRMHC